MQSHPLRRWLLRGTATMHATARLQVQRIAKGMAGILLPRRPGEQWQSGIFLPAD